MASISFRERNVNRPWQVRYRQRGSNRRKSFRRKRDAQTFLAQAMQIEEHDRFEQEGMAPIANRKMTLQEAYEEWRHDRAHLADATQDKDRYTWNKWLKPHLGNRTVGTLGYRDLNKVLSLVSESGAGPDTRISVYTRFNMIMDATLGKGNHTGRQAVGGTSVRKREIHPLTDEELDRLLQAVPDEWRLFVDLLATMGLRPHEARMLRGQDVQRGLLHVRTAKGNKQSMRVLPLPERLQEALQARAEEVGRQGRLFHIPNWSNWRRWAWLPAREKAGLPTIVPYDLRHTVASKLIARGASVNDVADWMGHSPELTLRTYAHLFPGRRQELASLLNR